MKVACWSGPRNISTALMRSWSSRSDTSVTDEPFYSHYLKSTKLQHPMHKKIIESYPSNKREIVSFLLSENPFNKKVWYQKHMAHHITSFKNIDYVLSFENTFLIRHPKKVLSSYTKKNRLSSINDLGFLQQKELINFLRKKGKDFIVIDSDKLLKNPSIILRKWCKKLGIPFEKKMLFWEKGIHKDDGIWAEHWYDSVINTNTFNKPDTTNNLTVDDSNKIILKQCMVIYDELVKLSI